MTPREQHEDIVRQLAGERKVRRLNLETLGADIGYSNETISRWERMKMIPTLNSLFAWASHLGYEVRLVRKDG